MLGILNIHKPAGVTSRDVVNIVQRRVRPAKCGHAGTLDPLATGVLVVCVGKATRLIEYVQRMKKSYRGTFLLGKQSDTEDIEGEVVEFPDSPRPTVEQLTAVLPQFTGEIEQRPPAYSALKVDGKRAYKLAREGKQVELPPRPVVIHQLDLVDYQWPQFTIDVVCGSGTYIRSLGRDIGIAVGTSAVMSALVRTAVGCFELSDAVDPPDLESQPVENLLRPAADAVADLPTVTLSAEQQQRIARGQTIRAAPPGSPKEVVALDPAGNLAAILVPRGAEYGPLRNFM